MRSSRCARRSSRRLSPTWSGRFARPGISWRATASCPTWRLATTWRCVRRARMGLCFRRITTRGRVRRKFLWKARRSERFARGRHMGTWCAVRRHSRALVLFAVAAAVLAHDPITTKLLWTQEISRIVYKHCASCHRQGASAMSLMTYEEARPWAKAIRDEVIARGMPPWGAVKGVGAFRDDPSLSQIEIDMIVNWVEGGAPQGDDVYLPPAPHFSGEPKPAPAAG